MDSNLDTEQTKNIRSYSYPGHSEEQSNNIGTNGFAPSCENLKPASRDWEVAVRVFDNIDYPYLIIDEDIRLIWTNRAARQVIGRNPDLEISSNGNLCAAGVTQSQWQRVFRELDDQERAALVIGRSAAVISELTPNKTGLMSQRQYLIALSKSRSCNDHTLKLVATKLGLTPSECKILLRLTAGIPPLKIAEERQVSESTVRAQIKAILAKFGYNSISNLLLETAKLPLDLS